MEASVSRLITTTAEDGEIVATGVEFIHGTDKAVHIAHARKEVILSAGYVHLFLVYVRWS